MYTVLQSELHLQMRRNIWIGELSDCPLPQAASFVSEWKLRSVI
jgi:hypothetical protein